MTDFRERLLPPWWLWVAATVFDVALAAAMGVALGMGLGLGLGAILVLITSRVLMSSAVTVTVADRVLTAGRARIPLSRLTDVRALDAAESRVIRGPGTDPAAYFVLRGWLPTGVMANVDDPDDPTPYWFISSSRPAELAAAITAGQQVAPGA